MVATRTIFIVFSEREDPADIEGYYTYTLRPLPFAIASDSAWPNLDSTFENFPAWGAFVVEGCPHFVIRADGPTWHRRGGWQDFEFTAVNLRGMCNTDSCAPSAANTILRCGGEGQWQCG